MTDAVKRLMSDPARGGTARADLARGTVAGGSERLLGPSPDGRSPAAGDRFGAD
jgi:hypothetical protein